jgi:hypothetical protein
MMVETLEPVEPGEKVGVAFTLPGSDQAVRATAEVVRVTHLRSARMFGVAIRFLEPEPAFRAAIRSFVDQEVGR